MLDDAVMQVAEKTGVVAIALGEEDLERTDLSSLERGSQLELRLVLGRPSASASAPVAKPVPRSLPAHDRPPVGEAVAGTGADAKQEAAQLQRVE